MCIRDSSRTEIEQLKGGKEQIIVTEIPYDVNKAVLVKKIDDVRVNNKVPGIAEVRDESDRTGSVSYTHLDVYKRQA